MGTYVVTAPDGKEYEVTAPEGATQAEILEYVKQNYTSATATPPPVAEPRSVGQELSRQAGLAGRAIYEGFTAPATMALEGVKGAYNLGARAIGSESRMPSAAAAQSQMLTNIGLPEPASPVERAAQAAMQGMVGAGAQGMLPRVVAGMETAPLTQDLARQIPAAAAAAGAAQPAAEKVKQLTGSDLAATLAGIGVGVIAGQGAAKISGKLAADTQPIVTMDEVRQRATRAYTRVADMGITLNDRGANSLLTRINRDLTAAQFLPENATPVQGVLNRYQTIVDRGGVSFTDVDQMRQLAGTLSVNPDLNVRRLARGMVASIDSYLANLTPLDTARGATRAGEAVRTILEARRDWRNQARATQLDDILNTAEAKALDPKVSESEAIRRGFINLAANKEKIRVFSEDERTAIRKVASGGSLDPLLSFAARFNPERNTLVSAGTVIGATSSPEISIPIAMVGAGADRLQAFLRERAARQTISGLLSGNTPAPQMSMIPRGLLSSIMTPYQLPEVTVEAERLR
jgi:uncharacterized protein YdbL (DUF1318 family)